MNIDIIYIVLYIGLAITFFWVLFGKVELTWKHLLFIWLFFVITPWILKMLE